MPNKIRTLLTTAIVFVFALNGNNLSAQKLYTMITQGGHFTGDCNNDVPQCGLGMISEYDLSADTITGKFDFTDSSGYIPDGYLMQASDGNLYGMTSVGGLNGLSPGNVIPSGGSNSGGTLFQYNPSTNTFTVEKNLDEYALPGGALMQASDGNLYGLTSDDGANYSGTLFQYNYLTNSYVVMKDLPDSSWPGGCSLMQATDGNLYGMTTSNGTYYSGTLFQYNYNTNTYTVEKNLPAGAYPYGSTLVEAPDSNLYGMTSSDGIDNSGTIFQYNYRTHTYTYKKSLPRYANPYACVLTLASDSNLYGITYGDGTHSSGTIFQYNYRTNTYTVVYNMPDSAWSWGSLMEASDGNLYGFTQWDGTNHEGTMFQYNYKTPAYTVKVNFDGTNGAYPIHNRLVEVSNTTGIENVTAGSVSVYPNPTSGHFTVNFAKEQGTGTVEIYNMLGERVYATTHLLQTTDEIDISSQPAGVYFLTVNDGTRAYCTKVVKE